jgi:vitamin B12 transporter
MKKSIRLRARVIARVCAPTLSVLSLAVAASVQAQGIEINPVVISASRIEQPLSEVLSSVSVITRADIDKSQAASLADLIQGEAGFEFGRNGGPGATTSFFMRGQESKNVLVLIDGVRSQIDGNGSLTITDLPLAQIERVEILRGNAGAMYGESAIGGVINVITRTGKGTPKAYGLATVGSRKTAELSVGYGGQLDGTSFDLNAGSSGTSGFSAMDANQNVHVNPDRDSYRSQYVAGKVDQKIDRTLQVGLRANLKNAVSDYDSGSSSALKTDAHQFQVKTDAVGGYVRKLLTQDFSTNLDITSSNFSYDDLKNGARLSDGLYRGHQDALRWSNSYELFSSTNAMFGVDRSREKFNQLSTYDMQRNTTGYFAGITSKLKSWTLQANARRDSLTMGRVASGVGTVNDFSANTYLLGAGYQLDKQWRLTSTVSNGFRAPTAGELFGWGGNPNLVPETHRSQELGLVYSVEKALVRLVYFQTRTQNAISSDSNWVNANIGEVRNKGYELTVRADVLGNNVKGALVLQDPWNITDGYVPGRRAKQYGTLDVSRWIHGHEVGAKLIGSGERGNFNEPQSQMLAGYSTWTFYASRRIDANWTGRVKLENAFNRNYELAGGYNTPGRGIFATLQYQPK